ncbi:hypothetical protein Prum_051170 [Phytohabitans rumicis]|uniref:Uncharacterized protein n=1 Tax=Phytohabitans rumicis TaxID=1076125 RepID=A0A6V8LFR7_9ACTN|nr:hypothetical protein Prum_051170 [Phytohabitans rumicis]
MWVELSGPEGGQCRRLTPDRPTAVRRCRGGEYGGETRLSGVARVRSAAQ